MPPNIDGRTKLAGLIGWPLEHTLSPAIHNAAYARMGLNWTYIPLPVQEGSELLRVTAALRALPFVGFNVTMPYKRVMLNVCDEAATQAHLAGSVNTVHIVDGRMIGYNTDGRGLVESLRDEAGFVSQDKSVVIVGAGGAAGAALVGLVLERAGRVTVAARDEEAAERLVDNLDGRTMQTTVESVELGEGLRAAVEGADLVINATPLGMNGGDPLPVPAEWLHSGQVVADMVYRPAVTPFMQAASARGAKALGGLGMLVAQAAIAIEIWNQGVQNPAPRDVMRAAAEAAVAVHSSPPLGGSE